MSEKARKRLSALLILVGVGLVAVGVVYEAYGYPWRVVLSALGMDISEDLPDPPFPSAAFTACDPATAPKPREGEPVELPAKGGLLSPRPKVDLTWMGTLKIPKLGISENVLEGTDGELLYGVGHVIGTALPGQPGNCGLAGHRNYLAMHPFRHLELLSPGDQVLLKDHENQYTYEIQQVFTVEPGDTWVVEPQEGEEATLTLITCTPVLHPTHRLVARGHLIQTTPLRDKQRGETPDSPL